MEVFLQILAPLGALLAGVAAYFSWKQYTRRPKLKFYPQESPDEKSPEIIYDHELGTADVVCLLANEGAVTAHNVYGWLQYCEVSGRAWPLEEEYSDVIDVADEYAIIYVEKSCRTHRTKLPPGFSTLLNCSDFRLRYSRLGRSTLDIAFSATRGRRAKEP
jgi:hypothetical protein